MLIWTGMSLRGVLANLLDCDILVNELELQSHNDVYYRTNTLEKSVNHFQPIPIDLFQNYLYSIGPYARKQLHEKYEYKRFPVLSP